MNRAPARLAHPVAQTGWCGADRKVHLVNDGLVTIPLLIVGIQLL